MSNKPAERGGRDVDEYGRTPLHYAAAEANADSVHSLLAGGADPNAQDNNGWTPLHFAAQATSVRVTQQLLEAGAEIDARDSYGNTPLSGAAFSSKGRGELILLLRGAGADCWAQNNYGVSPVSLARGIGNYDVARFFADLPASTSCST